MENRGRIVFAMRKFRGVSLHFGNNPFPFQLVDAPLACNFSWFADQRGHRGYHVEYAI